MNTIRLTLKIVLPLVVLGLGALIAFVIISNKQQPIVRAPQKLGPLVRTVRADVRDVPLVVRARGSVEPLRTVELAAEVGGRITATSDALRAGGTFTPNDVLVQIDAADYEFAITQQEAAIARARLRLMQEQAEAEAALRAWRQLEGDRPADPLVLREPQIEDARLALAAAEAQLEKAQLDLRRTKVQLPFAGRVRSVHADIGQTVQRGQRLAVVLDTSEVEVRLPIPLSEAAFVDLPLGESVDDGPAVTLSADFAGRRCEWRGRIVRVEGELDRRTRQITAIARVAAKGNDGAPPLLVGMFVEAEITGNVAEGVCVVPRPALRGDGDEVWVVAPRGEGDGHVLQRRRDIDLLRKERELVLLRGGVRDGELVCISNLDAPVDGMDVRLAHDEDAQPKAAAASDEDK